MTVSVVNFANPEVMKIPVARTSGGPTTDTLLICTGLARCNFGPFGNRTTDDLVFQVSDADETTGAISPIRIAPAGLISSAAVVSLASISEVDNDQGTWEVLNVDIDISDEGFVEVRASLAVSDGLRINLVAYQVNLQIGPGTPIG